MAADTEDQTSRFGRGFLLGSGLGFLSGVCLVIRASKADGSELVPFLLWLSTPPLLLSATILGGMLGGVLESLRAKRRS